MISRCKYRNFALKFQELYTIIHLYTCTKIQKERLEIKEKRKKVALFPCNQYILYICREINDSFIAAIVNYRLAN